MSRLFGFLGRAKKGGEPSASVAEVPVAASEPVDVPAVLPWHAAAEVSDAVASVLQTLGIDHWTVHPLATRVTIWAVRERDWPELVSSLAARLGAQGYVVRSGGTGVPRRPARAARPSGC